MMELTAQNLASPSVADVLGSVDALDSKRADNRIQNEYGPEVPSVPTLEGTLKIGHKDELEPDDLRGRADELDAQADSLEADE